MDAFDKVNQEVGELKVKEFNSARAARMRETAVYYDALGAAGQLPGNAPEWLELVWVVQWLRGEL